MVLESNAVGHYPEVADIACVHPTAVLIGHVIVLHRTVVEDVEIARDLPVPSGGLAQSAFDVAGLAPATAEMVAFARKVSRTNVGPAKSRLEKHRDPHRPAPCPLDACR